MNILLFIILNQNVPKVQKIRRRANTYTRRSQRGCIKKWVHEKARRADEEKDSVPFLNQFGSRVKYSTQHHPFIIGTP